MIYGFYFRFLKLTKNKPFSIILAKIAHFLYVCLFEIKRLFRRRQRTAMTKEEALAIVNDVYVKQAAARSVPVNPPIREDLDLSIVVPVYNYVHLIRANIESILNQKTKYRYELILVDDGSTDGSRDILLEYKDLPNVQVIFQTNQGIAGARNTGINAAAGKYLMFVDCDDTIHDDMVETMMDRACRDNCDIVMCAHNLAKEHHGQVYQVVPIVYPQKDLMKYGKRAEMLNYAGLPWCKVYKREMWNDIRYLLGYWYEDTLIQWLLFPQCKKFAYVPRVEYEYRWYENNFSHVQGGVKNYKSIDRYWMLLEIIGYYQAMGFPMDEMFYVLLLTHLSTHYYSSFTGLKDEIVDALFVLARDVLEHYKPEKRYRLPYMLRITEKALLQGDLSLWKLASSYQ